MYKTLMREVHDSWEKQRLIDFFPLSNQIYVRVKRFLSARFGLLAKRLKLFSVPIIVGLN